MVNRRENEGVSGKEQCRSGNWVKGEKGELKGTKSIMDGITEDGKDRISEKENSMSENF